MKSKRLLNILILIFLILFCCSGTLFAQSSEKGFVILSSNGNYRDFKPENPLITKPQSKAQAAQVLPSSYDLRNVNGKNYVSEVENQNPWGSCWAFGALSSAESSLIRKGQVNNSVSLSKRALTYYCFNLQGGKEQSPSEYEGNYATCNNPDDQSVLPFLIGGSVSSAVSQLATGNGASSSEQIPYQNDEGIIKDQTPTTITYSTSGTWSLPYEDIYDNYYNISEIKNISYQDHSLETVQSNTQAVKELMMSDGVLFIGFGMYDAYYNSTTHAQYVSKDEQPNHAVSIVGWDDNYAVTNFNSANQPPAPGAWICKNNWGRDFGYNGYFYLSYYDKTIVEIASFDANLPSVNKTYDNCYQYDYLGNRDDLSYGVQDELVRYLMENQNVSTLKAANVFTTDSNQNLTAFSCQTPYGAKVTTQVYLLNNNWKNPEDGRLVETQTNEYDLPGYYTFDLNYPISLTKGQSFAIVQSITYTELSGETYPGLPVEFGSTDPFDSQTNDRDFENELNYSLYYKAQIEPGQSFVYGVNPDNPQWNDITSNEIEDLFTINIKSFFDDQKEAYSVPGNVMIKAFTTDTDEPQPSVPEISVNDGIDTIYLTTLDSGMSTCNLTATVTPSQSPQNITWTISDGNIAALLNVQGDGSIIQALSEGETELTVTAETAVKTIKVIVNNNDVICSSITPVGISPDFFNITVNNVIPNPALNKTGIVQKVSVFCWSDVQNGIQVDINAKEAQRIPGTNNWQVQGIPVNNNEINNYFLRADKITINAYGSLNPNFDGNYLSGGSYDWIQPLSDSAYNIGYIGYSQNLGFDKPTVYDGSTAGTTGRHLNLEGIRISSNCENVEVNTQVHVQNIGWLNPVGDGTYAGTMHQNLGIEAVRLTLSGADSNKYNINYRVHMEEEGWKDWVSNGETAGSTGRNLQIEAIEVLIELKN